MRYVVAILILVVLLGGLAAVKATQIGSLMSFGKQAAAAGPPPEAVSTATAKTETWEGTLTSVGSVTSSKSVTVSNDAPGIVSRILFESGASVEQGAVLVELDANVERAQLGAAIARQELAKTNADRSKALFDTGAIAQAQLDTDLSTYDAAMKDAAAIQGQINRKIVRAPFKGRLGIRQVNLGQFLTSGAGITTLEDAETVFVDFSLPQRDLGDAKDGTPIRVTFGDAGSGREGAIMAVSPVLDPATRTVKIRANVPNKDGALRSGMFVDVVVMLPQKKDVVVVPATAVVHAPFGDSVFVVEDKPADAPGMRETPDGRTVRVAKQRFIRTGDMRGDFVAVLEGLESDKDVVSAGAFKLRNNAPVVVDNAHAPQPSKNPQPENR